MLKRKREERTYENRNSKQSVATLGREIASSGGAFARSGMRPERRAKRSSEGASSVG